MSNLLSILLAKTAYSIGGSFKTRDDRVRTVYNFTDYLRESNINITAVEHIKAKYIVGYIDMRKTQELDVRTLQNEMSHLRVVLKSSGRKQLADNPQLSNKSLGIHGGSRKGKKIPCPYDEFRNFLKKAFESDKGFGVCVMLGFYFGLRREEAIQSTQSIKTWHKQLLAGEKKITVVYGTKGGKSREVTIVKRDMALQTLKFAMRVMEERKGRLIDKPNLKEACNYFSNTAPTIGFEGELAYHSLRYAFAVSNVNYYLESGLTLNEAFTMTSMDLGHGDGRGRYIKMVYGRTIIFPFKIGDISE